MQSQRSGARRWRTRVLGMGILVVGVLSASGVAVAQTLPGSNEGPRFGTWAPGAPPPSPEVGPSGGLAAPGPAAPGPQAPAPGYGVPSAWGGCNWNLSGGWRVTGSQTTPWNYTYTARVQVRQYGSWLQIDQPEDNVSYYGRCFGNSIELDVYSGGRFTGYENGTVQAGQYGGEPRVHVTWRQYAPGLTAGKENWYRW
jgi:hypothetical protein